MFGKKKEPKPAVFQKKTSLESAKKIDKLEKFLNKKCKNGCGLCDKCIAELKKIVNE